MDIWYKVLAILGACAWLPQIIQLIIKAFTKTKLTIIPHSQLEIGYTTTGPIVNLAIALSAENSGCLVTSVEMNVKGPNNEQHSLQWQWFEEKLYEIEYSASELGLTPVKKQQNAIAIKVLKETLVEKKIGFHETAYKISHDEAYNSTNQQYELLAKNNQDINNLKVTREYDKFKNILESSLIWKEGTYEANIKVGVLNLKSAFNKKIKFHLNANQIRNLQFNVEACAKVLEQNYFPSETYIQPKWNWVYPTIIETNN